MSDEPDGVLYRATWTFPPIYRAGERWVTYHHRSAAPEIVVEQVRLTAQGTSGSAEDAKRLSPKGAGPVP